MKKVKFAKYIIAAILAAAMILSLVPASIMAEDGSVDDLTVVDPGISGDDEEEPGIVEEETNPEEESYAVVLTFSSNYENAAVTVTVNGVEQEVNVITEDIADDLSYYSEASLTLENGDVICVTAEADTENSYHVSYFTVGGEEKTVTGEDGSSYTWTETVSGPQDYDIYFEYATDSYSITLNVSDETVGSAVLTDSDGNEVSGVYPDQTYTLSVSVAEEYKDEYQIDSITVGGDGQKITNTSSMVIKNLAFTSDTTITVTFIKVYTVTINYDVDSGTVTVGNSSEDDETIVSQSTGAGIVSVLKTGTSISISATPNENYRVTCVKIQEGDGEAEVMNDVSGENCSGYSTTIDDINNDYVITVTFALNVYEMSAMAVSSSSDGDEDGESEEETTYGTVSFSTETVSYGGDVTVTITPASGKYVVESVAVYTESQLAALESTDDADSGDDETAEGTTDETTDGTDETTDGTEEDDTPSGGSTLGTLSLSEETGSDGKESEETESSGNITLTPSADGDSYSFTISNVTEALTVYVTYEEASTAQAGDSYFTTNAVRIKGSTYIFTKNDDGTEDEVEIDIEDSLTENDGSEEGDSGEDSEETESSDPTADFTAASGISGIRIYTTDESGTETVYGGYDEETQTMATGVSFSSDVTITKIQLYYQAEGESYTAWHDVDLGEDGTISVVFDKTAPTATLTVPAANDSGYYTEDFNISLAVSDTLSGIKSVTYYFEYTNDSGETVTTVAQTLYPADSDDEEDSEDSEDEDTEETTDSSEETTETEETAGSGETEESAESEESTDSTEETTETEESTEETTDTGETEESTDSTEETTESGESESTGETESTEDSESTEEDSGDGVEESLTLTIPVEVSAYESNSFKVYVTVTDLAYNTGTYCTEELKIASTEPTMTVTVTGTDEDGNTITELDGYYGTRTITVTVTDRAAVAAESVTLSFEASNTGSNYSAPSQNIELTASDKETGTYTGSVTVSGDAVYSNISLSYTNEAGLTADASVDTFTVDVEDDPTGSVEISQKKWQTLLETLTFGLFSRTSVTVTITGDDTVSGLAGIGYYIYSQSNFEYDESGALKALTAAELANRTFTTYENAFEVSTDQQFVVYAKITDNAGNVTYISSDGYVIDTTNEDLSITTTAYAASSLTIEKDKDGDETITVSDGETGDSLTSETDEDGKTTYSSSEIYNEDVYLSYTVSDADDNGSYSGIASVTYTITDGETTEQGTLYTYIKSDSPSYSELVSETGGWIKVSSATFNSSDVVVTITAKDNAGNETAQTINLDINTDDPVAVIDFADDEPFTTLTDTISDEDESEETISHGYYGSERTAVITIEDRETAFDKEAATEAVKAAISVYTASGAENPGTYTISEDGWVDNEDDSSVHTLTVTFSADALYTINLEDFSYTNLAENSTNGMTDADADEGETASMIIFTVDGTAPETVTISDGLTTWEKIISALTFGIWSKDSISVTADAADATSSLDVTSNEEENGIKEISYYKDNLTGTSAETVLSDETLEGYYAAGRFTTEAYTVSTDDTYVIYARAVDYAGNVTYVSTNGLIVDVSDSAITWTIPEANNYGYTVPETDEDGNKTITIDVAVSDVSTSGDYSGIKSVDYAVYKDYESITVNEDGSYEVTGADEATQSGNLYTYGSEGAETTDDGDLSSPVYSQLTSSWDSSEDGNDSIVVDASLNNSDDVVVIVTVTDNAGNVYTEYKELSINITEPTAEISFEDSPVVSDEDGHDWYDTYRTATVTIYDRDSSFNEEAATEAVDGIISSSVSGAYTIAEEWTVDEEDTTKHTITVVFSEETDSVYTLDFENFTYTNKANVTVTGIDAGESKTPASFTVDTTAPELSISAQNSTWYDIIDTITFGLWSRNEIKISATASDNISPLYDIYYYKDDTTEDILTASEIEALYEAGSMTTDVSEVYVSEDETYVVYARVEDYAGNKYYVSTNGLIYDDTESGINFDSPTPNEDGYTLPDADGNIVVKVSVDEENEESYSGISTIDYEIRKYADDTYTEYTVTDSNSLYTFGESYTQYDALVYSWDGSITVSAADNDSDFVKVVVTVTDNAGNKSFAEQDLKINVTPAQAAVEFSDDPVTTVGTHGYYDSYRTAVVTIIDRDTAFDEEAATAAINGAITSTDEDGNIDSSLYTIGEWKTDSTDSSIHTVTVYFSADTDGNYTEDAVYALTELDYTNLADVEIESTTFTGSTPQSFTVDTTDPTGTITVGSSSWSRLLSVLTFGLYSRSSVKVTADTDDNISPYTVEYYVYNEDEFTYDSDGELHVFTKAELDAKTFADYEDYTYEGDDQFVIYLKITDYAGNYIYINSDGYIIDSRSSEIVYEIVTAANENNIYSQDVVINYSINDEDSNGSYSGIKTVNWQITSEGEVTQSGSYDYSMSDPSYTDLVEYMEDSITVDSTLNNTSDVIVTIETEDYAGNTASVSIPLDIDITAPVIEVSYDNNDAENESYFDAEREATIVITERTDHFDSDNVVITITAEDAYGNTIDVSYLTEDLVWTTAEDSEDVNAATHTTTINYSEDANYTFAISYTDDAGWDNDPVDTGESVAPYEFTVDKTAPTGSVTATNYEGGSSTWTVLRTSLTYGFYSKRSITVTGTSDDATSPVYSVEYYKVTSSSASDNTTPLTTSQLDAVTSWADFSSLTVSSDQQFTVYLKITDYAGNYTYISTNGLIVDENAPVETITPEITISPAQPVNDIYSGDVDVEITVTDPLNGGTYSGISVITYEVLNMGTVTQSGTLYTFTTSDPSQSSLKQTWTGTITVDADLNNSNDVEIVVYASDNAGNSSDASESIQIDITDPTISVSYDNNSADSSTYFNANRTATITITERNFDSDDVDIDITNTDGTIPTVSSWTKHSGSGNGDNTYWTATITYSADGDYTFDISYTDEAGNKASAASYGSSVAPTEFTIDKTNPTISVSYDNNDVSNELYFNTARTMTITIVEHNFDASRVTITMTSSGDGTDPGTPSYSWTSSGDTHTATLVFDDDGTYTFDIEMTDMAGNSNDGVSYGSSAASQEFTIDTTRYTDDGSLVITGVENGVAYKDEVIPVISFDDVNYQSGSLVITLLRTRKDEIDVDVTDEFITGNYTETSRGVDAEFDVFEEIQDNDGIYTLSIYYLDLAGNEVEESVTFTINRFGSVYVYGTYLCELIADGGAYVQDIEEGLVITEYNPDRLVEGSLNISITLDGKPLELDEDDYTVTPVINDTVATGSSGWYQYEYVISADVFEEDGVYKMTISSEDATGNNPQSTNSDYDEIIFRVDTTAPKITSITGLEESIVNTEELEVNYVVYDTIALESVTVYVDGEVLEGYPVTDFDDLNNYEGTFTLSESASAQEIEIVVVDKAGNVISTSDEGFAESAAYTFNKTVTVSSKFFVRFYANKPLFWGTIIGIIVVIGIIIFLILFKRRKKEDEEIEQATEKRNAGKDTGSLKKDTKEINESGKKKD